jgi:hypothetical protein
MILDATGEPIFSEMEVLKDGDITLIPSTLKESKELILKFAMGDRYNKTPTEQVIKGMELIKYVWIGMSNGDIGGVIFMFHLVNTTQWWTLDAYKNNEHDNRLGDFSFRSGRLVVDWFFQNHPFEKEIYTMHPTSNRAAKKVCERLGFQIKYDNPEWNVLNLRRSNHGNL